MQEIILIPHGNISSQLVNSRKLLLEKFYSTFSPLNLIPLNCLFSIIKLDKQLANNALSIKQQIENSKTNIYLSEIKFDNNFFYLDLQHPLIHDFNQTEIPVIPFFNRINIAQLNTNQKQTDNNQLKQQISDFISTNEILNIETNQLRVFQLAELFIPDNTNSSNLMSGEISNKIWVKGVK